MNKDSQTLAAASQVFNTARVLSGQHVSIATCDTEGRPNVAPVGSMRVVDDSTVHILQGFLHQTCKNLERNPHVAFSICVRPKLSDMLFKMFRRRSDAPMGYQLYGELTGIDDSQQAVEEESLRVAERIPFLVKRPFLRFCKKNLRRLFKFRITGVRPIGVPT